MQFESFTVVNGFIVCWRRSAWGKILGRKEKA